MIAQIRMCVRRTSLRELRLRASVTNPHQDTGATSRRVIPSYGLTGWTLIAECRGCHTLRVKQGHNSFWIHTAWDAGLIAYTSDEFFG